MTINIQPILENKRIILYPLQEQDFEALYQAAADPAIWTQHPNPDRWKKDVFRTFFDGAMNSKGAFKIVDKTSTKILGSTRFYDYDENENSLLIGYTFYAKEYWGKGINLSVKALMLDYIFQFISQIGGIRQVIHVKGARNAPVILFLHGGPGSSRMKDAEKFTTELQQKFTVVQWDQRETGKTLQLNHTNKPITLSLMERDTYELVNSLLKRFHKDKLYLAGESWGTVLGFYMAAKHPELLHAYLAFSPVVDQVASEQMALNMVKNEAVQGGDLAAQHELGTVKIPFENVEQIYYLRKWLFVHDGTPLPDKDTAMIKAYMQSWTGTWMNTWNAAMQPPDYLADIFSGGPISCPTNPDASLDPFNPLVNATNNNMDAKALGYISPMQISRNIRSAFIGDCKSYIYPTEAPNVNPWIVNSDQTWDFAIRMYQDIIVKTGTTLTIKCEVQMPSGSRILVEKGAKLIIDAGRVTSYHQRRRWNGIELVGNRNLTSTPANQGSVELINGGIIENAWNGIRNFTWDNGAQGGGIIKASNAYFYNCWRVGAEAYSDIRNNSIKKMTSYIVNNGNQALFASGVGIYLDRTIGSYVACENVVDGVPGSGSSNSTSLNPVGLVANHTHAGGATVLENTFSNIKRAFPEMAKLKSDFGIIKANGHAFSAEGQLLFGNIVRLYNEADDDAGLISFLVAENDDHARAGQSAFVPLADATDRNVIHVLGAGIDAIPPQRATSGGVSVQVDAAVQQPGFYRLAAGASDSVLIAMNASRTESDLDTWTMNTLKKEWAEGRIVSISSSIENTDNVPEIAVPGLTLSTGWVDLFADYCEPGYEHKETIASGLDAARAGGFTDVLLLPNTNPVIDSKSGVQALLQRVAGHTVRLHPLGAVSREIAGKALAEMLDMRAHGAIAFTDGWHPVQNSSLLLKALEYVKAFKGIILQMPVDTSLSAGGLMHEGEISTRLGMPGIPALAETLMVHRDIELVRYTGSRLHITGISAAESVAMIRAAKAEGLDVTCSVTPYHLALNDEALLQYSSLYKVTPPLRSEADRQALIEGLSDGTIDCIA
ncbi:hypothetical protein OSTOST_09474, partial [Ostertagia ostertagi]